MASQMILVLDFGGQYNQLIARRVRECSVYCEVKPCTTPLDELMKYNPIGFIFTGGPERSPRGPFPCSRRDSSTSRSFREDP